jgi:hypothetical protein
VLDRRCDDAGGSWGNLVASTASNASTASTALGSKANDPSLSAQLLLAFMQGIGGVAFQGGVNESGETYASFGVNSAAAGVTMPAGWTRLILLGLGASLSDVVLLNNGGASPSGDSLTPWRPFALTL